MIKLLPVEYPPLTTNPSTAHSLSILWTRKEEVMPWFCGRFLQLVYADPVKMGFLMEELDENQISFPIDCPFVDTQYMDRRQMYSPPEKYSDFIKYHLSQDSYVILCVDGYNLGHSYGKLKEHVLHQALIYGFDDEREVFFLSDFYMDKYIQTEVSYRQVDETEKYLTNYGLRWFHSIWVIRHIEEPVVVHLEPGFIKAQVEDYINCRDSFYKYKVLDCDCKFGLKYYDCLIEVLWEKPKDMDLRSLHVLYQHKIAMQYRLDYMYQQYLISKDTYDFLCAGVNELKKETHRLREMGIKHCILTSMGKGKTYEDMIQKCSILKEKEYEVFSAFAEAL